MMVRLSNRQFIAIHYRLKDYWQTAERVYARVLPSDQWRLHEEFQFSKSLTDQQLIAHHRRLRRTALDWDAGLLPFIKQIDGGVAALRKAAQEPPRQVVPPQRGTRHGKPVVMGSIVRPIDADAFLAVLLSMKLPNEEPQSPGRIEDQLTGDHYIDPSQKLD